MIVIDCTQYSGKPDPAAMEAKFGFMSGTCPSAARTCTPPDASGARWPDVAKLRQIAAAASDAGQVLILDMEDANSPEQLSIAIRIVRDAAPTLKLGAYGIGPALGPAALQATKYSWRLREWWALQRPYATVADSLDILCPSLYSTGNGDDDARVAALALTFAAARWPHKTILPFISNRVAGAADGAMVSHGLNWEMVQQCANCADGCVLWTNPGEPWDATADFVGTAKQFATPAHGEWNTQPRIWA